MQISAMSDEAIRKVQDLERLNTMLPQVAIDTHHALHAGMYARTIRIPAGVMLTGAKIKIPTVLILSGDAEVYTGDKSVRLTGYHVITADAGRKQAFLAYADTYLTMLFPTDAQTVAQAENEFTDEADSLLSRKQLAYQRYEVTPCQEP